MAPCPTVSADREGSDAGEMLSEGSNSPPEDIPVSSNQIRF
jgi:hypothetical protein